jgi:hypothetical protein
MFWKEAWLKPVPDGGRTSHSRNGEPAPGITRAELESLTTRPDPNAAGELRFVCQATELPGATTRLRWWDPRQYLREILTGNVGLGTFFRVLGIAWFNALQRLRRGTVYPSYSGNLQQTPSHRLDLQPGERVRVRSLQEIMATLSTKRRNRGLSFVPEMVPFCGGEYRVLGRPTQFIDERTGKMIHPPKECIVLEGVICQGHLSRGRLFCPRAIQPFWREVWLERVE